MRVAIIGVFDENEWDKDLMVQLKVDYYKIKRVREDAFSIAKLNAKLENNMKEDMLAVG